MDKETAEEIIRENRNPSGYDIQDYLSDNEDTVLSLEDGTERTVLGLQSRKRKMILCPYLKSRLNIIKKNMETFLCGISLGILLITYMI